MDTQTIDQKVKEIKQSFRQMMAEPRRSPCGRKAWTTISTGGPPSHDYGKWPMR